MIWFSLLSIILNGQENTEFIYKKCNNLDSAIMMLTKAVRQQYKIPTVIDINKEYITQSRGKTSVIRFMSNDESRALNMYYENITKVLVQGGWIIHFESEITGKKDYFAIKNKEIAQQAFSALVFLIKNSGNTKCTYFYEKIILRKGPVTKSIYEKIILKKGPDTKSIIEVF